MKGAERSCVRNLLPCGSSTAATCSSRRARRRDGRRTSGPFAWSVAMLTEMLLTDSVNMTRCCRYTKNPRNRIRQHNGEVQGGAVQTRTCGTHHCHAERIPNITWHSNVYTDSQWWLQWATMDDGDGRVWLCQPGACNRSQSVCDRLAQHSADISMALQRHALQFEWAWQHPDTSHLCKPIYEQWSKRGLRAADAQACATMTCKTESAFTKQMCHAILWHAGQARGRDA